MPGGKYWPTFVVLFSLVMSCLISSLQCQQNCSVTKLVLPDFLCLMVGKVQGPKVFMFGCVYAKELALLYLAEIGVRRNDLTNPEV